MLFLLILSIALPVVSDVCKIKAHYKNSEVLGSSNLQPEWINANNVNEVKDRCFGGCCSYPGEHILYFFRVVGVRGDGGGGDLLIRGVVCAIASFQFRENKTVIITDFVVHKSSLSDFFPKKLKFIHRFSDCLGIYLKFLSNGSYSCIPWTCESAENCKPAHLEGEGDPQSTIIFRRLPDPSTAAPTTTMGPPTTSNSTAVSSETVRMYTVAGTFSFIHVFVMYLG